ncbi:MAG TPA: phenylalanine--tRNA ligase subunit beta [Acidimicrobiia bacterium]|nr:phenylalanine--tRNA ligase subunit beta [Acidimicrobiia bacterium]
MRTPLSWIREFAPIDASAADVADALNEIGLIVDAMEVPGREINGVVAARVLAVADHPDADKLTLVDIDHGADTTRVVCGARNLAAGDVVPYAPAGATLPGGFTLERRKIRGQVSDGMLCSARELGLGDDHDGILHLSPDAALGSDVREILGLDDVVYDLDITPNRPDAMSVVGVARDLAAKLGVPFALPTPVVKSSGPAAQSVASVEVLAPDRCGRYVAMTGAVRLGASPDWLARRLTLAGLRPIANVVDVTNYVLLERGQPLHAFDHDLLGGGGIRVRTAAAEERITTLDGVDRALTPEDLLICDAKDVPQAIAGVMGGATSEVHAGTTSVLLEAAYFQPAGILRTSKRLGLRSEASARFERGTDPNGVLVAAERAWELLTEVSNGEPGAGAVDVYPSPVARPRITLRTQRVADLLGEDFTAEQISAYLTPLELGVTAGSPGTFEVDVPTFRPDLEREVDLIEEVARLHGYNRFARTLPRPREQVGALTGPQRERRALRQILADRGCSEAMSVALVAPADLERAGYPGAGIEIENPLRVEESLLRTAILPGLLRSVAFNAAHGLPDVQLFEVGHVFLSPPPDQVLPDEQEHVAVVLAGKVRRRPREADRAVAPGDAVGLIEAMTSSLGLADWSLEPAQRPGFHPARCAALFVDGAEAGVVGEIAAPVRAALELPEAAVGLEVDLGRLLAGARSPRQFREPSRFPASWIDLAFSLPRAVPARRVLATLEDAGGALLEHVELFDVFESEALGAGSVSLAFRLRFRAPDRTLTDADVGDVRQACIGAVERAHGARLRG